MKAQDLQRVSRFSSNNTCVVHFTSNDLYQTILLSNSSAVFAVPAPTNSLQIVINTQFLLQIDKCKAKPKTNEKRDNSTFKA